MPKAELVYRPAKQSEKAEAGDYEHLCQIWEGLTVGTAKVWAAEMREHPDFREYVYNPTHKIVFVDYVGFKLFVRWKNRNRYRPKKETLAEMLKNIELEKRMSA